MCLYVIKRMESGEYYSHTSPDSGFMVFDKHIFTVWEESYLHLTEIVLSHIQEKDSTHCYEIVKLTSYEEPV